MTYAPARADGFLETDFRLGRVISKSIEVFLNNILAFSFIASLMLVPTVPVYLMDEQAASTWPTAIILLVGLVLVFALWPLISSVILYAAFQHMRGRPVRLGEAFARVLPRSLALLGIMLVGTLGMMIGLVVPFVFTVLGIVTVTEAMMFGMALVAPGLFLMVIWYVAGAACIAEKLGVRQSLRRSRELTKGFRWRIFALLLLIIAATLIGSSLSFATQEAGMNVWGQLALDFIWQGLSGGFGSVLVAVAYYHLRVAKEGVDVEQIAAVFD
jgi:hypothetical protein